jgi:AraC-like DNA-binding protein
MNISRPPGPPLRPFVDVLWASQAGGPGPAGGRELVLPTGALHIVVRLSDQPLRVFRDKNDLTGFAVSSAVIGGPRAAPYLRDVSNPVASVGALLRPGAGALLLAAPVGDFSARHTALEDVWGRAAVAPLRDRLAMEPSPARRLDLFEAALAARLAGLRRIDPRIVHALLAFDCGRPVAAVARDLDLSHRHFTQLFRTAVGLTPRTWGRLRRFGRALERLATEPDIAWADLAAAEGYADQPHFIREFRAFAGLAPGDYRRRAPRNARHVPL